MGVPISYRLHNVGSVGFMVEKYNDNLIFILMAYNNITKNIKIHSLNASLHIPFHVSNTPLSLHTLKIALFI